MFILGLTGSIGMGKTSAAAVFRRQKIAVFDADGVVSQLLEKNGEAVEMVGEAFKEVVIAVSYTHLTLPTSDLV